MVTKEELARKNPVIGLPPIRQAVPKGTTMENVKKEKERQRVILTNPIIGLPPIKRYPPERPIKQFPTNTKQAEFFKNAANDFNRMNPVNPGKDFTKNERKITKENYRQFINFYQGVQKKQGKEIRYY
jgi:hypothetical protein